MKHKFIYKSILILLFAFIISLPSSAARAGLISTEQEIELGREAARQVEAEYGVYNDPVMTAWVEKVGKKLAYSSPREGITYSFKILNMEETECFCNTGRIYLCYYRFNEKFCKK